MGTAEDAAPMCLTIFIGLETTNMSRRLALEQSNRSVAIRLDGRRKRSFWVLASFRLRYRVTLNLLLRRSLAKAQKSSLQMVTVFH